MGSNTKSSAGSAQQQTVVNAAVTGADVSSNSVSAPKKVQNTKAKALKNRKVKITWKKVNSASGYQIQYALNKKFTKGKKTILIKTKVTSKIIKNLKKGKTYYIKVRAYKSSPDGKKNGKWGKVKKIRVK